MTDRIRVSGFRTPASPPSRRAKPKGVPLIRLTNLIGPVGAVVVIFAILINGTPHLLLATTMTGSGAYRFYTDCAYAGLDGRMVHLRGGECPYWRLLKSPGWRN